jgi:hypothetical protein
MSAEKKTPFGNNTGVTIAQTILRISTFDLHGQDDSPKHI